MINLQQILDQIQILYSIMKLNDQFNYIIQ